MPKNAVNILKNLEEKKFKKICFWRKVRRFWAWSQKQTKVGKKANVRI